MSFNVARALAVGGQLIRVVFSDEPKHIGSAGLDDARNASNYQVTILTGTGQPLHSVGVQPDVIAYPAFGLFASNEFACDVQLDRPVIVGMTYQMLVSTTLLSAASEPIGVPYSASFVGAARPARTRQIRRKLGLVDLASDPFKGGIIVDSGGDWATQEGLDGTHKRVWRIALTGKGRFAWLPQFGLLYDIKKPATVSILNGLRTDLRQQLAQQPDVVSSETGATMNDATKLLTITIRAKTSSGETLDTSAKATAGGGITAS